MKVKYLVGVDEVGRGPLAGPVTVCAVMAPASLLSKFDGIKDSKQLSPLQREDWSRKIKKADGVRFAVSSVNNNVIDRLGIVPAVARAIERALFRLGCEPNNCEVLLDGGLRAPKIFKNQKTIIKGDSKIKIIAMASVLAKVHRDSHMARLAKKYECYGFEKHKGYGTKYHYEVLDKYGLCPAHRVSFLRNWIKNIDMLK